MQWVNVFNFSPENAPFITGTHSKEGKPWLQLQALILMTYVVNRTANTLYLFTVYWHTKITFCLTILDYPEAIHILLKLKDWKKKGSRSVQFVKSSHTPAQDMCVASFQMKPYGGLHTHTWRYFITTGIFFFFFLPLSNLIMDSVLLIK